MIAVERLRQIEIEGYTPRDDQVKYGQPGMGGFLALAGACYALPKDYRTLRLNDSPVLWPWPNEFWKPTPDDRVRELVKAGALITAEIDRLLAAKS